LIWDFMDAGNGAISCWSIGYGEFFFTVYYVSIICFFFFGKISSITALYQLDRAREQTTDTSPLFRNATDNSSISVILHTGYSSKKNDSLFLIQKKTSFDFASDLYVQVDEGCTWVDFINTNPKTLNLCNPHDLDFNLTTLGQVALLGVWF
jgi:hypothetical protein